MSKNSAEINELENSSDGSDGQREDQVIPGTEKLTFSKETKCKLSNSNVSTNEIGDKSSYVSFDKCDDVIIDEILSGNNDHCKKKISDDEKRPKKSPKRKLSSFFKKNKHESEQLADSTDGIN